MTAADITILLEQARDGEAHAMDELFSRTYAELRRIASLHLRGQDAGHTLNPTALVHEAAIRLLGGVAEGAWNDRTHFFSVASRAMRQVLLDHARARLAAKRGSGALRITLNDEVIGHSPDEDLLALNEALDELTRHSERLGRLVELRFFGGLNDHEVAAVLEVSPRTVQRDWRTARAFLSRQLQC